MNKTNENDTPVYEYFRTQQLAWAYCKAHGRPYKEVLGADNKKAKIGERWHVDITSIQPHRTERVIEGDVVHHNAESTAPPPPIRKNCEYVVIPVTEKKLNLFDSVKARLAKLFS